jgi:hypothetical protein
MKNLKVILLGLISLFLLTIGLSTATAKLDPVEKNKHFKTTISEKIYVPDDQWSPWE